MSDLALLKSIPKEPGIFDAFDCTLDDSISLEAASHKPFNIFDDESTIRQKIRNSNPVKKMMARQEKARRLSNMVEPRTFKEKACKQQQQKRKMTETEDVEKNQDCQILHLQLPSIIINASYNSKLNLRKDRSSFCGEFDAYGMDVAFFRP